MSLEEIVSGIAEEKISEWIVEIENRYRSAKDKINRLDLSTWPKPKTRQPSYLINGKEKTLSELSEQDLYPIVESLEGILNLSSLSSEEKIVLARNLLLIRSVFWDYEKEEDGKRKYEPVLSLTHLLTVAGMFENPSFYDILLALNHDTIEDSYRHKVLKRYYNGEQISDEDAKLVGLSDKERRIKSKKKRREVYERLLNNLIDNTISIIGVGEYDYWLKKDLTSLTHRVYESYEEYLKRLFDYAKTRGAEGFRLILIKAYDRFDNSHFNPQYDSNDKIRNATKVLQDAVKDVFVLELIDDYLISQQILLTDVQIKELLKVKVALGNLLAKNMNFLLSYLRSNYGSLELNYNGTNKSLNEWFSELDSKLIEYYKNGGFEKRDSSIANPKNIFDFDGSISLLSKFIEGRNIFSGIAQNPEEILILYKYCRVAELIGKINKGYLPNGEFDNINLTKEIQGLIK